MSVDHRDSLPWMIRPDNIKLWAEHLDQIENPHKNGGSLHRKETDDSSLAENNHKRRRKQ
tara:strand:+ start:581 stop:760 length:180 start_codon:yes stop_codon:yes gene_type:complete